MMGQIGPQLPDSHPLFYGQIVLGERISGSLKPYRNQM